MIELVIQFSLEIHHIEEAKWVTNFTVTLKEMTNVKKNIDIYPDGKHYLFLM